MPLLVVCRCLSRSMRRCFLARWTYILVSEIYRLVWKCRPFVSIPIEVNACSSSFQTMQQGLGLSGWICQNRYVIGVVFLGNCFCGVPSACFLCRPETVFFDYIERYSKHVVWTYYKEVWGKCVSLQYSSYNVEVVCVSIWRMYFHFGVYIANHYGCDGFFW